MAHNLNILPMISRVFLFVSQSDDSEGEEYNDKHLSPYSALTRQSRCKAIIYASRTITIGFTDRDLMSFANNRQIAALTPGAAFSRTMAATSMSTF